MIRTKIECACCGKLISLSNIERHKKSHIDNPNKQVNKIDVPVDLTCRYCGRVCPNPNSFRNHERLCKLNPDKQLVKNGFEKYNQDVKQNERTVWNKGQTKDTSSAVAKNSESLKKFYETHDGSFQGKHHSLESRTKIAMSMAGNTHGNRSKKGFYKGIFCGSSYELVYVIYNIDHGIEFSRCDRYYEYEYKGTTSRYFPDFELPDGTIVEVKGYHTELVDIKAAAVKDRPIKLLYRKDLEKHFEYVCSTYNVKETEVYKLYEKQY